MSSKEMIRKAAEKYTDEMLVDSILVIDRYLDNHHDLAGRDAQANRLVRACLYEVLESRHPEVEPLMEAWVMDADDRTYTEALLDALGVAR